MDLTTIANFAEAFAVIVAVIFGIVQLRQIGNQRRREAAFALMQSIQSPQMLRAIPTIDRLPNGVSKVEIDGMPESDQADVTALLVTWESLGILVFQREIPLQMVDDFYSGTIAQSWLKLQRYVKDVRDELARPTRWEWFQWLAERMQEHEKNSPPVPAHIEHRKWDSRG